MPVDYSPKTRQSSISISRHVVLLGGLLAATGAVAMWTFGSTASTPPPALASSFEPALTTAMSLDHVIGDTDMASASGSRAEIAQADAAPASATAPKWTTLTIRKGQTLSTLLDAVDVPKATWMALVNAGNDARRLRRLTVGKQIRIQTQGGKLLALNYPYDTLHTLHITQSGSGFIANTEQAELTHKRTVAHGAITHSLFVDGENAGLTDQQILKFAHIFKYDVDFSQDIQRGDRFTVVYDRLYKGDKKLRNGEILAAEIRANGRTFRAVRYTDKSGSSNFYTVDGHSLHRAFIRTPVDFTRISSGFSRARMNPVLHIVRPHNGTDLAAPMGTPIHATANGRIVFRGRLGGYGNCIKIRSFDRYETIYGHMSRFQGGLRVGSNVKQGQVIGYVGMTGYATGPHVHYEVRVNGVPQNPMTMKLPNRPALPASALARFKQQTQPIIAAMDDADTRQYASAGPTIGTR
ncbi:MAG: peptidase M23 [Nevskiaceae bacterium]|nr:MAG: peptidase M23 [Nevskiaceae bacterium]TBR73111.1 MAG: peptidase M23 [Nevskiaceae bacterium]